MVAARKEKVMEKRHLNVSMLPEFAKALQSTSLISGNEVLLTFHLVHPGKAVDLLRDTT